MRAKESRAGVKVWATITPAMLARVDALVPTMPEDERERHEPTRPDAVRLLLARGLAWVEAHGHDAVPPTPNPQVKRAPLAKAGKRSGR